MTYICDLDPNNCFDFTPQSSATRGHSMTNEHQIPNNIIKMVIYDWLTDCLTDWLNDAFSQNRELLLDERILGIATVPRRVTGCACGVGVPLMWCKSSDGGGIGAETGEAGTERGARGED